MARLMPVTAAISFGEHRPLQASPWRSCEGLTGLWADRHHSSFHADPKRLKKFARTKDETWIATLVRFFIRQEDSPITQYYED